MVLQCGAKTLPYIRFANSLFQGNGSFFTIGLRASQRCYSTDVDTKAVATATAQAPATSQAPGGQRMVGLTDHKVNKLEKYFLVWGGKFKSVSEVPEFVSQSTMERARNKARIKINLMMGVGTLFGCLLMVVLGKRAAKEGQSVAKMNAEWHNKVKEQSKETAN